VVGVEARGSRWKVEAWGADPAEARQAARELFSLDHPIEQFYAQVRRDPVLNGSERRFPGLRIPRDASVYEALLHAIVGQQLSVRAANTIQRRLFERVGSYLDASGVQVPSVPTPSRLAALSMDDLRAVGVSRAKALSLQALATWAADEPPSTRELATMPLSQAVDDLDRLPGVGRWTAENALLRGVGRPDVFVAGDLGIRVALEEYGVLPRSRPEEEARAWGERFYPGWGSYATLYLWRKLTADRARGDAG
jgi:3-methyladenine DNA glycosylase/8-oxoguanine DNA glycosylase